MRRDGQCIVESRSRDDDVCIVCSERKLLDAGVENPTHSLLPDDLASGRHRHRIVEAQRHHITASCVPEDDQSVTVGRVATLDRHRRFDDRFHVEGIGVAQTTEPVRLDVRCRNRHLTVQLDLRRGVVHKERVRTGRSHHAELRRNLCSRQLQQATASQFAKVDRNVRIDLHVPGVDRVAGRDGDGIRTNRVDRQRVVASTSDDGEVLGRAHDDLQNVLRTGDDSTVRSQRTDSDRVSIG